MTYTMKKQNTLQTKTLCIREQGTALGNWDKQHVSLFKKRLQVPVQPTLQALCSFLFPQYNNS